MTATAVLTNNAIAVLEKRYLEGERVDQTWKRVSGGNPRYESLMSSLRFLPNSPTIFNMGRNNGCTLSACFVFNVGDYMISHGGKVMEDSIVRTREKAVAVAKAGGGVGYYLGNIRPKNSLIKSVHRKACGPVNVLRDYHGVSRLLTQGGKRELAQMAVLNRGHGDISEFIRCKDEDPQGLGSFNISVSWDDEGLGRVDWSPRAVTDSNPTDQTSLWWEQCEAAWAHGCPGMLFHDTVNRTNFNRHLGLIYATNPCGETPNRGDEPCLSADSLIETPEGLFPIKELLKREEFSVTTHEQVVVPGCRAVTRGLKKVLRVTLNTGQVLRCTPDHKILTNGGWCRADELTKGSLVRVQNLQTAMPQARESLIDEMLGWQLGDGWHTQEDAIGILFSADDREAMDKLMPVWDEFVEKDYALQTQKTGVMQKSCEKASMIAKFTHLGFKVGNATKKVLPEYVFTVEAYRQQAFLRGLFSADGHVKMAGCGLRNLVTLASSSKKLLRQVQVLLMRFGIQSRIQWTVFTTVKRNDQGMLQISGASALRYMDVIGFNLSAKTNAFQRGQHQHGNKEYIPVKKVDKIGVQEEVFDILMPERHHFIAEGMVVHNCNLGSLSLPRYFRKGNRDIDWKLLEEDIWTATEFLDDILDWNVFPHPAITEAALLTRKLGLGVMGWADLLSLMHIHYDTQEALDLGEKVMSLVEEVSHACSENLAKTKGPYNGYSDKTQATMRRNETNTSIAPTGTIAIIAGVWGSIEPYFALRCQRTTAEGMVLQDGVQDWVWEQLDGFIPKVADEVSPEWHIKHQATFQRHTDLGCSKTINLPNSATVQDVSDAYRMMYETGCKGGTVFRNGCRAEQVLVSEKTKSVFQMRGQQEPLRPKREKMPTNRKSITHKFKIDCEEGYLTVGLYDDGRPGEIFLRVSKQGSTISGLLDSWAIAFSLALQHGTPITRLVDKHIGIRFEPAGLTKNEDIPVCTSVVDYVSRWLENEFVETDAVKMARKIREAAKNGETMTMTVQAEVALVPVHSGQLCPECGKEAIYQAGCLVCPSAGCGWTRCG